MKTLTTLLFLIAVSFAAVAQEKDLVPFGKNIDPNPVNTLKQRLDSLIVFAYPMQESNGLENWEKKSFTYNAAGLQTSEVNSRWNADISTWISHSKTDFYLNPNGSVQKSIMYLWDPLSEEWRDALKKEFTYDMYLNLLTETEYAGGDPVVPWMPQHKSEYTWDQSHNLLSKVNFTYQVDEAIWVPQYKYDKVYNPNGFIVTLTESSYNPLSLAWENRYQYEYSYSMNFRLSVIAEYGWNVDLGLWENRYKDVYTYNSIGKPGAITRHRWDKGGMEWQLFYKQEYVYDFTGNQVRETGCYYDHFVSAWRNDRRKECEYNLAVTIDKLIGPHDLGLYGYASRNMMASQTGFRNINDNWVAEYQYAYYYNPFVTSGIGEIADRSSVVFPNPATSGIRFSWKDPAFMKELEVYDLGGKLILKQSVYQNVNIEISALPEGGYIYRLFDKKLLPLSGKFNVVR